MIFSKNAQQTTQLHEWSQIYFKWADKMQYMLMIMISLKMDNFQN